MSKSKYLNSAEAPLRPAGSEYLPVTLTSGSEYQSLFSQALQDENPGFVAVTSPISPFNVRPTDPFSGSGPELDPFQLDESEDEPECRHPASHLERDIEVCVTCGEVLTLLASGKPNAKMMVDSTRLSARRGTEETPSGLHRDVEGMGFSEPVIEFANKIYSYLVRDEICKGKARKCYVFGCMYKAYEHFNILVDFRQLFARFNLTNKAALKGIKHASLHAPKALFTRARAGGEGVPSVGVPTGASPTTGSGDGLTLEPSAFEGPAVGPERADLEGRTGRSSLELLVREIMKKFSATEAQCLQVEEMCRKIQNRSNKLNRSRPQSVAWSLVYYWFTHHSGLEIPMKEFLKKTPLSELTINKIVKEIGLLFKRAAERELEKEVERAAGPQG